MTRADLRDRGIADTTIRSWLRSGRLHPVYRGVYVVGHPLVTQEERWLAAVRACGPGAVLSHLSAALLWGIVLAEGRLIDVTAPRGRKGQPGIRVHRPRTPPAATTYRGIPVTTIAQTLLDLAATFTPPNLAKALGEAELLSSFDEEDLERAIQANAGRPGSARLRAIFDRDDDSKGIPRNIMEARFRKICREAGLPRPEVNQEWGRWEIDFLFREHGVAVETDGRDVHTRRAAFQRDREKDRELQLDGLIVLRFTYAEVMYQPEKVRAGCCRACASGPARAWSAASGTP